MSDLLSVFRQFGTKLHFGLAFTRLFLGGIPLLRLSLYGLDLGDKRDVVVSFCYLTYVESCLNSSDEGFKNLVELCRRPRHFRHFKRHAHKPLEVLSDQIAWSIDTAAVALPKTYCLGRSISAFLIMKKYDSPVSLVIGTNLQEKTKLAAHAWLEFQSEPLSDSIAVTKLYSPILRIDHRQNAG